MPSGGGKEVNEDFSFVGIFIFETFVPNIWVADSAGVLLN